jgi:hypothetical protein
MKTISRWEFLMAGVGVAATISSLEMIGGCATTETTKVETLVYPPLPYNKIQPPKEGCLIGFFEAPDPSFNSASNVEIGITYIEKAIGTKPSLYSLVWPRLYSDFPMRHAIEVSKKKIIPYVYAALDSIQSPVGTSGIGPKEIAQSKFDSSIKKYAQGAAEFGKEYGGFLFTTMEEMNGNWFSWGKNSSFIPAWRHIWQLFEDQGANQHATWVWAPYCAEGVPNAADDPELYYPGDKYVDWIGLNAYSVATNPKMDYAFDMLIRETYRQLFKKHTQKPFMISSLGRTNEYYQYRWLSNAYRSLKNSFTAIKAVMYHDNVWWGTGDHTLNSKSWQALKKIFKDPYWIMAK